MWGWLTRCLPGFSIIALALLLICAFSDFLHSALWKGILPPWVEQPFRTGWLIGLNLAQSIFVVYAVVLHLQMFMFTIRLAWSFVRMTSKTKEALDRRPLWTPSVSPSPSASDEGYDSHPPSPVALPSPIPFGEKLYPITIAKEIIEDELIHAIILPNYCEDIHTLETTLKVLASHPRAKSQYEVSLQLLP